MPQFPNKAPESFDSFMPVRFTPEKIEALRNSYKAAVFDNRPMFSFEGKTILTDYAKYLIMYLDSRLPSTRRQNLSL